MLSAMLDQPTRVVVTGAAGFIGSHLCDRLLALGHEVIGIDSFSDYYGRARKKQNLEAARNNEAFTLVELDLVDGDIARALRGASVVFHLAGQPGVRPSWGDHFDRYVQDNIVATQRVLEALRENPVERLVFASSSSVYGDAEAFPTRESALPRPVSPYGMTKLAAEHLVFVYMRNFGVPATSLRYFTVYGPRQRPDMAFCRFMEALVDDTPIEIYGDGEQTREFTFVSDAVEGTVKAASADVVGQVVNLGGGSRVTVNRVLDTLEDVSGKKSRREYLAAAPGDPRHTGASINVARDRLGWEPRVSLREGLAQQWNWFLATLTKKPGASPV
jgi:nucleoside-diphosphate-sugar epimerase